MGEDFLAREDPAAILEADLHFRLSDGDGDDRMSCRQQHAVIEPGCDLLQLVPEGDEVDHERIPIERPRHVGRNPVIVPVQADSQTSPIVTK